MHLEQQLACLFVNVTSWTGGTTSRAILGAELLLLQPLLLHCQRCRSCSRSFAAPSHTSVVVEAAQRKQSKFHCPMPLVLESHIVQEAEEVVCVREDLLVNVGAVFRPLFPQKGF